MSWKIKKFDELTTTELYNILKERAQVFVVEQNCVFQEVDGKDLDSYHLFREDNGRVIAYVRIVPAGLSFDEWSIGRVIVHKDYRGNGLAYELMNQAIEFLNSELKIKTIKIQAQEYLHKFYSSFGFQSFSEVYLEDDIPHIDMILQMK